MVYLSTRPRLIFARVFKVHLCPHCLCFYLYNTQIVDGDMLTEVECFPLNLGIVFAIVSFAGKNLYFWKAVVNTDGKSHKEGCSGKRKLNLPLFFRNLNDIRYRVDCTTRLLIELLQFSYLQNKQANKNAELELNPILRKKSRTIA